MKSEIFKNEIELIQNEDYKMFVKMVLDTKVPLYFWEIGASSSGKYHPKFSQGEGGLVRHTKAVVKFCHEFMNLNSYGYMCDEFKDYAIMACIFHDCAKYGMVEFNKSTYKEHGKNASYLVKKAWESYFGTPASEFLLNAIRCHMGQWSEKEDRPFTQLDRLVHMADYVASRNFIDIPELSESEVK